MWKIAVERSQKVHRWCKDWSMMPSLFDVQFCRSQVQRPRVWQLYPSQLSGSLLFVWLGYCCWEEIFCFFAVDFNKIAVSVLRGGETAEIFWNLSLVFMVWITASMSEIEDLQLEFESLLCQQRAENLSSILFICRQRNQSTAKRSCNLWKYSEIFWIKLLWTQSMLI